jgi:DNA (cytosine-5)-methyltransferase 1
MVQSYSEIKVENQTSLFEENTSVITEEAEYVIETICSDLEAIGYTVQPIIIPACAIGAPHRRDRIWFIAHNSNAGIEGVRSEREDSISGCKTTTDSNQCAERSSRASRKTESNGSKNNDEQKEWGEKTKQHIGCHDVLRTSTNSHNPQRTQQANEIQTRGNTVDDGGITNTNNEGLQRGTEGLKSKKRSKPIKEQSSRFNKLYAQEWENFPTESPIRTGDDGFSEILARITVLGKRGRRTLTKQQGYNRFCQESIKAFGNAVVPQIPYEIFKAINSQIKKED